MGKAVRALLFIGVTVLLSASACTPREGGACAKRGDTYTSDSKVVLECVLEKDKLVWRKP